MATIIIKKDEVAEEFAKHLTTNKLELLFAISLPEDKANSEVDVYSAGAYPSQGLINIVSTVLKQLIRERNDYLSSSSLT